MSGVEEQVVPGATQSDLTTTTTTTENVRDKSEAVFGTASSPSSAAASGRLVVVGTHVSAEFVLSPLPTAAADSAASAAETGAAAPGADLDETECDFAVDGVYPPQGGDDATTAPPANAKKSGGKAAKKKPQQQQQQQQQADGAATTTTTVDGAAPVVRNTSARRRKRSGKKAAAASASTAGGDVGRPEGESATKPQVGQTGTNAERPASKTGTVVAESALVRIQSAFRGHSERRSTPLSTPHLTPHSSVVIEPNTQLQALNKASSSPTSQKQTEDPTNDPEHDGAQKKIPLSQLTGIEKDTAAATKIQAVYRGHAARVAYKQEKEKIAQNKPSGGNTSAASTAQTNQDNTPLGTPQKHVASFFVPLHNTVPETAADTSHNNRNQSVPKLHTSQKNKEPTIPPSSQVKQSQQSQNMQSHENTPKSTQTSQNGLLQKDPLLPQLPPQLQKQKNRKQVDSSLRSNALPTNLPAPNSPPKKQHQIPSSHLSPPKSTFGLPKSKDLDPPPAQLEQRYAFPAKRRCPTASTNIPKPSYFPSISSMNVSPNLPRQEHKFVEQSEENADTASPLLSEQNTASSDYNWSTTSSTHGVWSKSFDIAESERQRHIRNKIVEKDKMINQLRSQNRMLLHEREHLARENSQIPVSKVISRISEDIRDLRAQVNMCHPTMGTQQAKIDMLNAKITKLEQILHTPTVHKDSLISQQQSEIEQLKLKFTQFENLLKDTALLSNPNTPTSTHSSLPPIAPNPKIPREHFSMLLNQADSLTQASPHELPEYKQQLRTTMIELSHMLQELLQRQMALQEKEKEFELERELSLQMGHKPNPPERNNKLVKLAPLTQPTPPTGKL
ncbi:hypothetical protein Pelo_11301 [Pelomyxa schiedti]|nr:hypothetical protein Pelo_11301 [Pelomyxa schiedti]